MKINYEFYKDKELVPIKGIVQSLELDGDGRKFLCPCHNDSNPSMSIHERTNRFKCFSCGEGGDALNLVMAVRYNIKPSEYYACPNKYSEERNEAARYINSIYPGGILEDKKEKGKDDLPDIPAAVLKEIGLLPNFVFKLEAGIPDSPISVNEAALIIANHIKYRIHELSEYQEKFIMKDFPDLTNGGRRYIRRTTFEKCEFLDKYLESYVAFLKAHNILPEINDFEDNFEKLTLKRHKKNTERLNDIYDSDYDFPKIPDGILKALSRNLNLSIINTDDNILIAETVISALNELSSKYRQTVITILKNYPELCAEDKKYIKETIKRDEAAVFRNLKKFDEYTYKKTRDYSFLDDYKKDIKELEECFNGMERQGE